MTSKQSLFGAGTIFIEVLLFIKTKQKQSHKDTTLFREADSFFYHPCLPSFMHNKYNVLRQYKIILSINMTDLC